MNVWKQIDQLKAEHDKTKESINALKGWRFRGRKPNGDWWARYGRGRDAVVIRQPTSPALIQGVTSAMCPECKHLVQRRQHFGCNGRQFKGGPRCDCKTCVALAPPKPAESEEASAEQVATA